VRDTYTPDINNNQVMCGPPLTQKGISKKLGKQMAEQGYTPNIPIVLVPGTDP
jgi:hypothetical protein